MNEKQFEILEKQKRIEYEIELEKLQEDFAGRGLAYSGMRNKAEKDLKTKHENEIEIARLGIEDEKTSKNSILNGAIIKNNTLGEGATLVKVQNETKATSEDGFLSKFFWTLIVGIVVVVIGGLILKNIFGI